MFEGTEWSGRQPRIKRDYINATLDIGYTILFNYIDCLLSAYGFDTYYGVLHRQFYMRKSLTCDIVEPFRPIIDKAIRTSISRRQIKETDFTIKNYQRILDWDQSAKYTKLFLESINEYKAEIFDYMQNYYRAFMKGAPGDKFPVFDI